MSYAAHQRHGHEERPRVRVGVVTASDSRNASTDDSGRLIAQLVSAHHELVATAIVPDSVPKIRGAVDRMLRAGADVVIVNGGTGVSPRDVTIEALAPWFEKELPGFGERLRALSVDQVGSGAWLSRATAATLDRRGRRALLFLLPGSPDACRLATERLILPELSHAVTVAQGVRPHA